MQDQVVVAIIDMLVSIDLASEEEVDSDFAASLQGEVANVFDSLSESERHEIIRVIEQKAEREEVDARREVLVEMPDAYGLRGEG